MTDQITTSLAEAKVLVMRGAAGKAPRINAENNHWEVYDNDTQAWVDTGVTASIDDAQIANAVDEYLEEHPVSVPVDSVNGKTGAVVLGASDVGALPADTPIPAAVTEQTVSGWGFTKNTGTYVKPSSGIPKTDLASDVQTSLGKADTALQEHQSLSGYATENYVQQQIAAIPDELPSVSASDNGKVLGVVNGAWAAKTDEGGSAATVDSALSSTSENPVQNKVIKEALDGKGTYSKPSGGIPKTDLSQAVQGELDSIMPFEIPVSQSGDDYTTTASAADIIAHVGNLVLVDPSGVRYKETSYLADGNSAYALFTFGDASGGNLIAYGGYLISVESGTVNISLLMKVSAVVPDTTSASAGDFLRLDAQKNIVWETVQTYQGGSY